MNKIEAPTGLLQEALARSPGCRNDTGLWLSCQLRDNGVPYPIAEQIMLRYQQGVSDRNAKG